ncbi:unnamed protein product [Psylliodes chrysocephalus]|uniref:Uncharacterized protein n=1 Tax=Psylliodes chrysocephalus TaxID=3402493 RepID=A0A9P0CTT0_9CUCU|nr:unnamed protein product [Psylliodes chrysocephala]
MEENELLTIKPFKSKTVNRKSVTSTSNEHDYYQTLGNNNHNRFDFYYDAPETFDHILAGSKWNDDTKKPKSIVDIRPFMREKDFVVNYVTVPSVSGLTCKKKVTVCNLCIDSPRQTLSTCHRDQPESEGDVSFKCGGDDPSTGHIRARSSFVSCDCAECKCNPCCDPNCQNKDPIKTLYESDQCTYSNDHCELSNDPSKAENNCKCGKCLDPSELSCNDRKRKEDEFSNYVMGYVCIDCKVKRDPNTQREPVASGTSSSKPSIIHQTEAATGDSSKESKAVACEIDSYTPFFVQQLEERSDSSTVKGIYEESNASTCQTDSSKPYFVQQLEEPTRSTMVKEISEVVRSACSKISKVSKCHTDSSKPCPVHPLEDHADVTIIKGISETVKSDCSKLSKASTCQTLSSKPCPIHQVQPRNTTIGTSIPDVVKYQYSTESKVATSETSSSKPHQLEEPVDIDTSTIKSISGSVKYNYSKESKIASSNTNSFKPYLASQSKKPTNTTTIKSVSDIIKCRCSIESKPDRGDGTCKCDKICLCKKGELDKELKIKPITDYNVLQSCTPCNCPVCKCESSSKGGDSGKKKSESCTCDKCNCSPCEDSPKPGDKGGGKDITPCTCQDCKCDPCSDPTKVKGKGKASVDQCKCDNCKCSPCSDPTKGAASGGGAGICTCQTCKCSPCTDPTKGAKSGGDSGGTCDCSTCKCDPCSDPSKKKVAGGGKDECKCSDCTCKECAFKKGGGGKTETLMCDCKECTCPVCTRKADKGAKSDCTCSSCPNPVCADKSKGKSDTIDCNCKQCSCPVCSKKKDGGAKRPSSSKPSSGSKDCTCTKCGCPSCSKKPKGGGSGGESKKGCDCKNCTCPVCTKKGDKGDKGGKESKLTCNCKECTCPVCTAKGSKAGSSGGESGALACTCTDCTCPVCTKKKGAKAGGEAKLTCNCKECTCPVCTAKGSKAGSSGGESGALACTCTQCSCPVCTKKGGAKASGGESGALACNCTQCSCPVCTKKGGAKASGGESGALGCTCTQCSCPVCTKKGGAKASGGEAKLTCNCKDCTCPVCTAGGGKKGTSGGESGGLVTEGTLKCNCENCKCPVCTKKEGGGGGGSKGAPCKCPSTGGGRKPSSGSPKKPSSGGGGQRAATTPSKPCKCDDKKKDTVTCTCQTCTCSPCKAGGGKPSSAGSKPTSNEKGSRGSSAGKTRGPCKCPSKTGGGGLETTATLMCNCNPCSCPVCTKKPAGGKKSGTPCKCPKKDAGTGEGGVDFGGPTISCNCKECTCPVCTKRKPGDKKPGSGGAPKPPPGRPCKCPPKKEEKEGGSGGECLCKSCGCGPCPRKSGGKSGSGGSGGGTKRTVGTSPSSAPVDEPIQKKCACVGTEAPPTKTKTSNLMKIGTGGSSSKLTCKCLKCDCADCMAKRADKGVGHDVPGDIVACEKCSCPMDKQKPVESAQKEFKSTTCSCFDLGEVPKRERGEDTTAQKCGRCGCVNCKLNPSQMQLNPKVFICSMCTCSDQPTFLTKYAHTPSRHSSKSAQEYLSALSRLCSSHVQQVELIEAPPPPPTALTSAIDCKQTDSEKRLMCRCTAYCSLIQINAPSEKGDVAVCTSTILREIREMQCETNPIILREALVGGENPTTPKDKSQNTEKCLDKLEQQAEHQPELIKNMILNLNNTFQAKRKKQRRTKLGHLNLADIPPFEPPRKVLSNSDTCSCIICASKRMEKNLEPLEKPTYHSILKIKSEWQKVLKSKATKTEFPNDNSRQFEYDFPRYKFRDYFNDPYFAKYVLKGPNMGSTSSQGSQDKSEERIAKPLLVKKEDDFDLTMSNLMIAYSCLEKKGKAKDQMIEGLSEILKSLGGENICESIMNCPPIGTAPDYDRCDDLRLLENCNFDYVNQDKNRVSSHSTSSRLKKSQAKLSQPFNSLARSSDDSIVKQLKRNKYQSSVKEMCESRSSDHLFGNFNEKMAYYSMYSRNGSALRDYDNTCRVVGDWKTSKQENSALIPIRSRPLRSSTPVHLDHQSESSIQLAINKLKRKCKEKDALIKVTALQLRKNISNRTLANLLKVLPGAIGMNIFNTIGKDEKENKHPKDEEIQKKITESGKMFANNAHVSLEGFEITSVIRITVDSLIMKWSLPKSKAVCGYDISINGKTKIKVMSGIRTCTMIHSVDLSKPVFIAVYAVTACGRCEPPATAIFELQTKCK